MHFAVDGAWRELELPAALRGARLFPALSTIDGELVCRWNLGQRRWQKPPGVTDKGAGASVGGRVCVGVGEACTGDTAALAAARTAHGAVAKLILRKDAAVGKAKEPEQQRSMLHFAAMNGDERLVEALLANGAPPSDRDRDGFTPLLLAVRAEQWDAVRRLMRDPALSEEIEPLDARADARTPQLRGRADPDAAGCDDEGGDAWTSLPPLALKGVSRVIAAVATGRLSALKLHVNGPVDVWQHVALASACATDAAQRVLDEIDADGRGVRLWPRKLREQTLVRYAHAGLGDAGVCVLASTLSPRCECLDLSDNPAAGLCAGRQIIATLERLKVTLSSSLLSLSLEGIPWGEALPTVLGELTSLRTLNVSRMSISGPPLADALAVLAPLASTLRELSINDNPLGGHWDKSVVRRLATIDNLVSLDIRNIGVTGGWSDDECKKACELSKIALFWDEEQLVFEERDEPEAVRLKMREKTAADKSFWVLDFKALKKLLSTLEEHEVAMHVIKGLEKLMSEEVRVAIYARGVLYAPACVRLTSVCVANQRVCGEPPPLPPFRTADSLALDAHLDARLRKGQILVEAPVGARYVPEHEPAL